MSYNPSGNTLKEIPGIVTLSYTVDVFSGIQYQFHVRAVTIKPGPNANLTLDIPEYGKLSFLFGSSNSIIVLAFS